MLRKGLSNRTRNTMLVVSVVMYTVSATHWALTTAITVRRLRIGKVFIKPIEALTLIYVPSVNFILSDCIILWRAWVLWDCRFILFTPPAHLHALYTRNFRR
ncbi:hypothetical protein BJV78DRAFT_354086 [Lactifluus subvellereus]|nr:hypothetical protein BJV78DRAFT_354086 [Lactifluus subvellereus]